MLTIALSKGRILDDTLPLLAEAGIVPTENIYGYHCNAGAAEAPPAFPLPRDAGAWR